MGNGNVLHQKRDSATENRQYTMIYFLQETGGNIGIKIGYTASDAPTGRQRACQTGNSNDLIVLATMPGTEADEDALHNRFAYAQLVREWFRPVPELIQFIIALAKTRNSAPPALPAPTPKRPPWPLTIYLAGKISRHDWRGTIVEYTPDVSVDWFDEIAWDWDVQEEAIFGFHHYSGPFFVAGRHGQSGHGDDSHGAKAQEEELASETHIASGNPQDCQYCDGVGCCGHHDTMSTCGAWLLDAQKTISQAPSVVSACKTAIDRSDLLFAWIDQLDCYGTIAEIGYAHAMGKMIWIAGPRRFRDMWFVYQLASKRWFADDSKRGFDSDGPSHVLENFLDNYAAPFFGSRQTTQAKGGATS